MTPTPQPQEPCGGCGETNPSARCIGCLHQFTPTQPQEAVIPSEGAGRPDDYEGPDVGMHDTEIEDRDDDDFEEAGLLAASQQALDFLRNAPLESGICCCGDPIAGHNFGSGHAPVDDLAYHSDQVARALSKAISKATGNASASTCGIAPLGDEPKPSTREAEAPVPPCYECGSTERMGTACAPCNPEITDPAFGMEAPVSEAVAWTETEGFSGCAAPSPASAWKPGREAIDLAVRRFFTDETGFLPSPDGSEAMAYYGSWIQIPIGRLTDAIAALMTTPPATEGAGE